MEKSGEDSKRVSELHEANSTQEEMEENELMPQQRRAQVGALPLDWTRVERKEGTEADGDPVTAIRLPQDVTDIDPLEEDLVLVGTAGKKITAMGANLSEICNPHLKQLILRSHLIRTMEGLGGFEELDLLELYDNTIEVLGALNEGIGGAPGANLRVLDMSYNVVRDMAPVQFCPNLQELYLANNKIKAMAGLKSLSRLRKIDLGANRIRVMEEEELSGLEALEELWLGKNKIEHIQGINKLTKLRRLDVQSNRLTEVSNLEAQVETLEELYLAHNGITDEGASLDTGIGLEFIELVTLDLGRNQLTTTNMFSHLTSLNDLWLGGNKISSFDDVQPLSHLGTRDGACLDEIYLEYNPIAEDFEYRKRLKEIIPSLGKIDADLISGLVAHGYPSVDSLGAGRSREEQNRRMQEAIVARAKPESTDD